MIWFLSLLCHLVGDYPLQSHTMATRKTSSWKWAAIHAAFYSLPFVALALLSGVSLRWAVALAVIGGTHAAIDRLGIARRWCRFYGVGHPGLWWTEADRAAHVERAAEVLYNTWKDQPGWRPWVKGGDSDKQDDARREVVKAGDTFPYPPPFLGVWLVIIVDNTLHLLINTLAITYAVGAVLEA